MLYYLADEVSTKDWGQDLKSVIFVGVFAILAIIVFVWWLRRG